MSPRGVLWYPLKFFSNALRFNFRSHKNQRYVYHKVQLFLEAHARTWLCLFSECLSFYNFSLKCMLKPPPNKLQLCFVLGHSEMRFCCEVKKPSSPWTEVSENNFSSCYWWQGGTGSPCCAPRPPTPWELRAGTMRISLNDSGIWGNVESGFLLAAPTPQKNGTRNWFLFVFVFWCCLNVSEMLTRSCQPNIHWPPVWIQKCKWAIWHLNKSQYTQISKIHSVRLHLLSRNGFWYSGC